MCLITKTNKPLIAKTDIVCYKVLDGNYTPYQRTRVGKLKLIGILPFKAKNKIDISKITIENFAVSGGMIHTFSSYAIAEICCFNNCFTRLYKCIIPKGTEYFIDEYSSEYCSRKIRFVERIK